MSRLSRLFHKTCKYEIYCLYISYIVNFTVVNIFFMLATGVSNIQNESLSQSDRSQLIAIVSSIVSVSAITIIFFQWIINMQIQALYNRRNQFNINARLIGVDRRTLCMLYLQELLFMQIIVILIGIVLSEITYFLLAAILNLDEKIIPIAHISLGIIMHILVITITELTTILKLTRKGVAEQIRKTTVMENIPEKRKLIISFISGTALIILSVVLAKNIPVRQVSWLSRLIVFLSFFFFYDIITYVINKLICRGAEKLNAYHILLAQRISYGYFRRVKITCMMIIFSATLFLGLQMLYKTVRAAAYDVVENNIKYDSIITWDEMQNNQEFLKDIFYGIRIKTKTDTGTNIYISGINQEYAYEYEQINSANIDKNDFNDLLCNPNSNGIILPEFYISDNDIGKEITVKIENCEINFRILGGYYSNDFSKLICYVNDTYLKEQLNLEDKYNIAYVKATDDLENLYERTGDLQSKTNIAEQSVNKAVGGTEIVEMITLIIIICAIISFVNFFIMTASTNSVDIIRFRAMGINTKDIMYIYILHSIFPVIFSSICIIPFSILFNKIACNVMLASEYFSGGYENIPGLTVVIIIIFILIAILMQVICVKKTIQNEEYMMVLKTLTT